MSSIETDLRKVSLKTFSHVELFSFVSEKKNVVQCFIGDCASTRSRVDNAVCAHSSEVQKRTFDGSDPQYPTDAAVTLILTSLVPVFPSS